MKERIKLFLTEYSREKILALFITFIIYTFAIDIHHESKNYPVKVKIITATDQIIVSEPFENVMVKVKGSVFDFAVIKEENLVVTIDISSKKPGKFTRFLDSGMMPFGEKIIIDKIFPSELVIRTARKIEKKVAIEPLLDGQLPSGWRIAKIKVTPEKIIVSGPEKELNNIKNVLTEKIELSEITQSTEKKLKVSLPSQLFKTVKGNSVTVNIEIEKNIKPIDKKGSK